MSDPVTNVEIEDVLASIRRLVSDEVTPESRPQAAAQQTEKLVLTPALRVASPLPTEASTPPRAEGADAPATGPATETRNPAPVMHLGAEYAVPPEPVVEGGGADAADLTELADLTDESSIEEHIVAHQGAVPFEDDQWEPDGDDDDAFAGTVPSMDWVDHTPQESVGAVAEGGETPEEAPYWHVQEDDAPSADITHIDGVFAAGDLAAGDLNTGDLVDADEIEEVFEEAFEDGDTAEDALTEAEDLTDTAFDTAAPEAQDWGGEAAELDDSLASDARFDDPMPDAAMDPADLDDTPDAPADSPADAAAEMAMDHDPAEAAAALDDLSALGMTDSVLDEDMLRDLVADIVRQELQGSLGERITRNVRKLVRREIQRALTARDLS